MAWPQFLKDNHMRFITLLFALGLGGCGVTDVATTAATSAKLQTEQAKQAKETMEKMKTDINAANKSEEQRNVNPDVEH